MAGKVSIKTTTAIFLLCTVILALCACIEPVNIKDFLRDEDVQKVITKTKGTVIITKDSVGTPGNREIYGLTPGIYYKIEEMENNVPKYTYFVKADGTTSEELKDIKKLTGREITGLTNDVTYRVKSAIAYTNSDGKISHFAVTDPLSSVKDRVINDDGTVTIYEERQSQLPATKCYFKLSNPIDVTQKYKVMKISETNKWSQERISAHRKSGLNATVLEIKDTDFEKDFTDPSLLIGIYKFDPSYTPVVTVPNYLRDSIMEVPAVNTKNDYVFVEYKSSDVTGGFYFLTVNVKPPVGDAGISITPPTTPADPLILTPPPVGDIITISRGASAAADRTITVTPTGSSSYNWFYDDNKPISGILTISGIPIITSSVNTIVISPTATPGNYSITVEVTIGAVDYSKRFILKITL
jgi:hypothetical protein